MYKVFCSNRFNCEKLLKTLNTKTFCDNSDNKKKDAAARLQDLLSKLATETLKTKESEKLLVSMPPKKAIDKRPTHKIKLEKITNKHTAKLVGAVKEVADHVGKTPLEVKTTEAELLHVILNNKRPESIDVKELKLSNVISGMDVDKTKESRADQVRRHLGPERTQRLQNRERTPLHRPQTIPHTINLFEAAPLGIFSTDMSAAEPTFKLRTWERLQEKDLRLRVTHPPSNIYEEMIRWTERGQLWHFPIDNEQGMDDEKAIDFTQHVFLEEHLAGWCPVKGPVKQFMDLVLIGLSKNPYLTVTAKVEHIHWFRDYFESKRKILQETGSLPDEQPREEISH